MFILLRKQHLKNMAHQPFSRIFLMTCYSVASAHIVPYIVLAARGLNDIQKLQDKYSKLLWHDWVNLSLSALVLDSSPFFLKYAFILGRYQEKSACMIWMNGLSQNHIDH